MKSLYEKIVQIYPSLTDEDFSPTRGTIFLQNDSDGKGDYIKSWNNVNPQPSQSQLDAIN
jgi:hypothetical protein